MVKRAIVYLILILGLKAKLLGDALILVSSHARPYLEVADGIVDSNAFDEARIKFLEDYPQDIFLYSPWFAIGGDAFRYLLENADGNPVYFAMVEHPSRLIPGNRRACGIRIAPKPEEVVNRVTTLLSILGRGSLSVFFNPHETSDYVREILQRLSQQTKVDLLKVTDRREIPVIFRTRVRSIGVLLILPDPGIVQKEIILSLLKSGVKHKIIVIGYNKWFVENGALFAYYTPYKEIGNILVNIYKGGCPRTEIHYPPVRMIGNETLLERWGIRIPQQFSLERWKEK